MISSFHGTKNGCPVPQVWWPEAKRSSMSLISVPCHCNLSVTNNQKGARGRALAYCWSSVCDAGPAVNQCFVCILPEATCCTFYAWKYSTTHVSPPPPPVDAKFCKSCGIQRNWRYIVPLALKGYIPLSKVAYTFSIPGVFRYILYRPITVKNHEQWVSKVLFVHW